MRPSRSRGVIYCITGSSFFPYCYCSIAALRQQGYTGPILLLTDSFPPALSRLQSALKLDVRIVKVAENLGDFAQRWIKTQLSELTPFQVSLYLDADTLATKPVEKIWEYADESEIAMSLDRVANVFRAEHSSASERHYTRSACPPDSPQYNSGVMLWTKTVRSAELFRQWHAEWDKFRGVDQLALLRALHSTKTIVAPIDAAFNTPILHAENLSDLLGQPAVILHFWYAKELIPLLFLHLNGDSGRMLPRVMISAAARDWRRMTTQERGRSIAWLLSFLTYYLSTRLFNGYTFTLGAKAVRWLVWLRRTIAYKKRRKYGTL
jgi:hypothetical protein